MNIISRPPRLISTKSLIMSVCSRKGQYIYRCNAMDAILATFACVEQSIGIRVVVKLDFVCRHGLMLCSNVLLI
jgi:hypothetical protein